MAEGLVLMTRQGSFNVLYLAGMAALALLAAVAGLALTGERHSGFVGSIEIVVLVVAALLFVAAGLGAGSAWGPPWPLLAAVAAVVLVAVLAFLTMTQPDTGSAVFIELAAVAIGLVLVAVMRKG